MLSGLRVVSRGEAKLETHREKDNQRPRKHGKEKKRKHKRKRSSKRDLESSEGGSDSDSSCKKSGRRKGKKYSDPSSFSNSSDGEDFSGNQGANNDEAIKQAKDCSEASRKAAGLEWMVQAPPPRTGIVEQEDKTDAKDNCTEEKLQVNPRELNPFLKGGGDGYPSETSTLVRRRLEAPVVGDGGLSWRLKALRRAKEQAEREGRKLDMVVEERWGSLAEMTVSVSAKRAAHAHAHLHATRERKSGENINRGERETETCGGLETVTERDKDMERISFNKRDYLKDVHSCERRMKAPQSTDSLYCKRRKDGVSGQSMRIEDRKIFDAAASAINQFQKDGSFLQKFKGNQHDKVGSMETSSLSDSANNGQGSMERLGALVATGLASSTQLEGLNANQLAAKALQL